MGSRKIEIRYEEFDSSQYLDDDESALIDFAWKARDYAYSPYSHFKVGAAVRTHGGIIYTGSNQENANFNVSCAERVVLNTAGAAGDKRTISKIAVVGGPEDLDPSEEPLAREIPVSPCGSCRQELKEVESLVGHPLVIILASRSMIRRLVGIQCLLPMAFGPMDLSR